MTGRFSRVRGTQAPEDVQSVDKISTPEAPEVSVDTPPPPYRKQEARSPMGVRVKPSLQQNLNDLVEKYKRLGWDISQNTVLEHFLARLGDEEYAREFMKDLAKRQ
ncbi:hypothetical protein GCM10008019_26220 [Deinococcus soli (ex Cha et al. 2016)]|nr:hypothetical protein GCM10008019_26220 [Deinococcus soli (ex Cha et al. 2016)]